VPVLQLRLYLRALLLPTDALDQTAIISFTAVALLVITSYTKRLPSNGMLHTAFMYKTKPEEKNGLSRI
jgi:hypothetical protein